jgi:hypothetical protein
MACLATWHSNRELLRAFAERASLGVDVRRLHQGVSPSAATWLRVLLDRAAETLGAPIPHPELVASALLGLWMRVGLASLLDPTPAHAELAELLTRLSLGAIGGVIGGAIAPHEMGPPAATSARRRTRRRTTTR